MAKKKQLKKKEPLLSELYIHGEVESWHVLMVAHDKSKEVLLERAQYEEKKPDGTTVYTRKTVRDSLTLEMDLLLPNQIQG